MPNNARYKFKVGELVLCKFTTYDGREIDTLALVMGRNRERDQWWMENMYELLLQQSWNLNPNSTLIYLAEKHLSKVK